MEFENKGKWLKQISESSQKNEEGNEISVGKNTRYAKTLQDIASKFKGTYNQKDKSVSFDNDNDCIKAIKALRQTDAKNAEFYFHGCPYGSAVTTPQNYFLGKDDDASHIDKRAVETIEYSSNRVDSDMSDVKEALGVLSNSKDYKQSIDKINKAHKDYITELTKLRGQLGIDNKWFGRRV